ncbi:hypothetical protein [Pseudanabaena yagii]|nr:hypothetical protein [Pseudanabaena yagii]
MKNTRYITATVLDGNRLEIETPDLPIGQTIEVILVIPETLQASLTLSDRYAFLKLPIAERQKVLSMQAEAMIEHYENNTEWKDLMTGDIVEYSEP